MTQRLGTAKVGSDKKIVAPTEARLSAINATTTVKADVVTTFLTNGDNPGPTFRGREIFLNQYYQPGGSQTTPPSFSAITGPVNLIAERKRVAGTGVDKPFDVIEFSNTAITPAASSNIFLAITDFVRGNAGVFLDKTAEVVNAPPVPYNGDRFLGGIAITTGNKGHDLIIPSGPGLRTNRGGPFFSLVNRSSAFVNIGNGDDAIIGGYEPDYFGSKAYSELYSLKSPTTASTSAALGTKFFVGGSYHDVLDGGLDSDYLIGDRFNGYELYFPLGVASAIPSTWDKQKKALSAYQPEINDGLGNSLTGTTIKGRTYSLWMPGNDVIRSHAGNDLVFGDDNALDNLAQLKVLKDNITGIDPSDPDKYGSISGENYNSIKLGADFIDAGEGNDEIHAGFGSDAIIGGGGADIIDIGAQVAVAGYTPFFGPKVVYGDNATWNGSTWASDLASKSPDIFIVGSLYTRESEISSSNSDANLNYDSFKSIRQNIEAFEKDFKEVKGVLKLIPKIGTVAKVVDAGISILKAIFPDPKPFSLVGESRPKANDAITVIKDFDAFDQITFSLPIGEKYEERVVTNFSLSTDNSNPLLGVIDRKPGTVIEVRGDVGTVYDRIFLEGYTGGLVGLKRESTPNATLYTLGGRDFRDILNENGSPVYGDVF